MQSGLAKITFDSVEMVLGAMVEKSWSKGVQKVTLCIYDGTY